MHDIFNEDTTIPHYLKFSNLMLLIKDKDKAPDLDNLRPIALSSVITKLIEAVLLHLMQ